VLVLKVVVLEVLTVRWVRGVLVLKVLTVLVPQVLTLLVPQVLTARVPRMLLLKAPVCPRVWPPAPAIRAARGRGRSPGPRRRLG
jgi:hypothetical protein